MSETQPSDQGLNLGKYVIRSQDDSGYRIGSFYRRQKKTELAEESEQASKDSTITASGSLNSHTELSNNASETVESPVSSDEPIGIESLLSQRMTIPKQMQKKVYPKQMPYDKILSHVTFVMSGYENPRRSKLRDMALEMGATYKPAWNRFCTHLICAFKNTPKYKEVMAENGRIVREHWIQECSSQRQLLDWRKFKLGNYPYPDSEEEVDVNDLDYALEAAYGPRTSTARKN